MSDEDKVVRILRRRYDIHGLCKAMGWKPQYILGSDKIHGYTKGFRKFDKDIFIEQEHWTKEDLTEALLKLAQDSMIDAKIEPPFHLSKQK